jgi:hypothetical protein
MRRVLLLPLCVWRQKEQKQKKEKMKDCAPKAHLSAQPRYTRHGVCRLLLRQETFTRTTTTATAAATAAAATAAAATASTQHLCRSPCFSMNTIPL